MITQKDVVKWIINNRTGDAFRDYPHNKIVTEVAESIEDNSFVCVVDNNKIVGIVCAKRKGYVMYIYDILCTRKGALKAMLIWFNRNYPYYSLQGRRRGVVRSFNTSKLESKL